MEITLDFILDCAIYGALVVTTLMVLWALRCNVRAFRQRQGVLDAMMELHGERFWALAAAYGMVSYDQHMYALVLFRDPWKLYPESIQELVRK